MSVSMEKYTKIETTDKVDMQNLKNGTVIIEEKIDGSQFRIKIRKDGVLTFGSKSVDYTDESGVEKMFQKAVDEFTLLWREFSVKNDVKELADDIMIFGEYLQSPKHNTLHYARTPLHNVIIFDIRQFNSFYDYDRKKNFASQLGLETVPLLWKGDGSELSMELIESLLKTDSLLGNEKVEGVVMKNYSQFRTEPRCAGAPMFAKYVRPEFKELNASNWKMEKSILEAEILNAEAKWQKAYIHCKERGELENMPRDIPKLVKEIHMDIEAEDKERIKELLWDKYGRELKSKICRGFAYWYKKKLMTELLEGTNVDQTGLEPVAS